MKNIHNTALIFTIVFAAYIGVIIPQNVIHTKKTITPKVNITCLDNKCDTTYIYSDTTYTYSDTTYIYNFTTK